MRRVFAIVLAAFGVACSQEVSYFAQASWPDDGIVVVSVLDEANRPLEDAPRIFATSKIDLAVESDVPVRFHVEVFDGTFDTCEARYEVTGDAWPASNRALVSPLVDDVGGTISLEPRTGERPQAFYFARPCLPMRSVCDDAEVRAEILPLEGADLFAVDLLENGDLVVGGSPRLLAKRRADGTVMPFDVMVDSTVREVIVESSERVIALSNRGTVYELDAMGTLLRETSTGLGSGAMVLEDGTLTVTAETGAVTIARGATVALARTDLPPETRSLLFNGADRFAVARGVLYAWDGTDWVVEASELLANTRLYGDGVRYAAISTNGILLRSEEGRWLPTNAPFESMAARGAAMDGTGRTLFYGEFGSLAILERGRVDSCRVDPGLTSRWWSALFVPSGNRAYVVGSNTGVGTDPAFLTIDLSDM